MSYRYSNTVTCKFEKFSRFFIYTCCFAIREWLNILFTNSLEFELITFNANRQYLNFDTFCLESEPLLFFVFVFVMFVCFVVCFFVCCSFVFVLFYFLRLGRWGGMWVWSLFCGDFTYFFSFLDTLLLDGFFRIAPDFLAFSHLSHRSPSPCLMLGLLYLGE